MGLDVYLYRYTDYEAQKKASELYEERTSNFWSDEGLYGQFAREQLALQTDEEAAEAEAAWQKRDASTPAFLKSNRPKSLMDELSPERQEVVRAAIKAQEKAIQKELGVGEYGEGGEQIEIDSKQHPEHMFKIGYLRSSYNEGGINSVLRTQLGRDLYSVFNPNDEYEFCPDWNAALDSARDLRDEFQAHVLNWPFQVTDFKPNVFAQDNIRQVTSEERAKEIVSGEIERKQKQHEHDLKKWEEDEKARVAKAISDGETNEETLKPRPYKSMFGSSYGNSVGDFFLGDPKKTDGGINMIAAIVGTTRDGSPVLYMAHTTNPETREFEIMTIPMARPEEGIVLSKEQALDVFRKEWLKAEKLAGKGGKSSTAVTKANGHGGLFFFPEDPQKFRMAEVSEQGEDDDEGSGGLNVFAIFPGATATLGRPLPSWYAVYHATGMFWYLKALNVTVEMCEWVLEQDNPQEFYLHWSS